MEKIVINCPKCSFSFLEVANIAARASCPACGSRLGRDDDGIWFVIRREQVMSKRN